MKKIVTYVIFIFITGSCKEKYAPSVTSPATGYLVVEGFINSGSEPSGITLSRSIKLVDSVNIFYEHNAVVNIESDNNESFPLIETGNGVYVSASLHLNSNQKYRLNINTRDGKQYTSDFTPLKHTPAIDSISWTRENGGAKIYVNTHDPQNNTKYYHWKYEETWEFHATYYSSLIYLYDNVGVPYAVTFKYANHEVDTTIHKCWQTVNSTNINLGSSEKLTRDLIYLPLIYIEPGSEKLSVLYSVNVRQYAISHDAYLFFQRIKKNTEGVGSIFDAQPSELHGNIQCITNPSEIVIGYVEVSEEQVKRIFIKNEEVPDWNYATPCSYVTLDNIRDSIRKYGTVLRPTVPVTIDRVIRTFEATAQESCMNCTVAGTNVRPAFWP